MEPKEARKLVNNFQVAIERYEDAAGDDNTSRVYRQNLRNELEELRTQIIDALTEQSKDELLMQKVWRIVQSDSLARDGWEMIEAAMRGDGLG